MIHTGSMALLRRICLSPRPGARCLSGERDAHDGVQWWWLVGPLGVQLRRKHAQALHWYPLFSKPFTTFDLTGFYPSTTYQDYVCVFGVIFCFGWTIAGNSNAWGQSALLWNMALDQHAGPRCQVWEKSKLTPRPRSKNRISPYI
jgi:hypothetical protein